MANNESYNNRKQEALQYKAMFERLRNKVPVQLLDEADTYPAKLSKERRTVYNEMVAALNNYRIDHPVAQKVTRQPKGDADEMLALVLSDLHFGKYSEVEGEVAFNVNIARKRTQQIISGAKHLYNGYLRGNHAIDDFHIFFVGDAVDGEQIYAGQAWNLEMPVVEQLRTATQVIGDDLLGWASATFNNVVVHTVQGNHGQIRKGGEQIEFHHSTNFDNVLALMLEMSARNLSNVKFDIGLEPYHIARVPRHGRGEPWKVYMTHQMPPTRSSTGVHQKFGLLWERYRWDLFLTAHWHNWNAGGWQGHPIVFNGALFGSDDDYTAALGFNGFPSQTLMTIADSRPMALLWPIDLSH